MSKKAEEAALKAFPVDMHPLNYRDLIEQFGGKTEIDINTYPRRLFQQGYEQAEEDLALSWEDISDILTIDYLLNQEIMLDEKVMSTQEFYTEVLRRFNESKAE